METNQPQPQTEQPQTEQPKAKPKRYYNYTKEQWNEYQRRYRQKNREKYLEDRKRFYREYMSNPKNREATNAYHRVYSAAQRQLFKQLKEQSETSKNNMGDTGDMT